MKSRNVHLRESELRAFPKQYPKPLYILSTDKHNSAVPPHSYIQTTPNYYKGKVFTLFHPLHPL